MMNRGVILVLGLLSYSRSPCESELQYEDILTKALGLKLFYRHRS